MAEQTNLHKMNESETKTKAHKQKEEKNTKQITQRRENQSISINRIGICACFIYKCYTFNSGISY